MSSLEPALIAAGVSLVVAVISQWFLTQREDVARIYERRRVALTDAHDAARLLREAVRAYGRASRRDKGRQTDEFIAAEARFEDAASLLDVLITRVDSSEVLNALATWRGNAQVTTISQVGEAVTDADERSRWEAMNDVIGLALKSKDGLPEAPTMQRTPTRWWSRDVPVASWRRGARARGRRRGQ